jgi:DNA helicase-2/ATP-dependent DNA helicase PcrA
VLREDGDPLLDDLNPEQREAVLAPAGPVLVLAGAGSGKTRVLTRRLARLIRDGADPRRMLAITFTNKAARELTERVEVLLGGSAPGWVHTFHAACARMLRREIARFGYTRDFTILDADDQRGAVREVLRELDLADDRFPAQAVAGRISRAKNELLRPEAVAAAARDPWSRQMAQAYARYQAKLERANCLDFDDLIVLGVRLLEEDADAGPGADVPLGDLPAEGGARYRALFRHVLVDEYQDTNHAQYRLVRALVAGHRSLTAVGDEDQSIYRFRGADSGNIQRFEEDFPDARVVRLERNYRSTQAILDAAGAVIQNNARRYPKQLWTDGGQGEHVALYRGLDGADEADFVAREIARLRPGARGWGDFAILYRMHAQSRAVEEALLSRGIPYTVVGGLKFYERKEIKDAFSYLRLLVNPLDWPSFRRAIAVPRRGVGDATLEALARHLEETGEALGSALGHAREIPGAARAARALEGFAALLDRMRGEAEGTLDAEGEPLEPAAPLAVPDIIARVLDLSGLEAELRADDTIEGRSRLENLDELRNVAEERGRGAATGLEGLRDFLQQATLVAEADNVPGADEGGAVVCLTLHAAKGLEFPVVFLLGMEDGVFPHSRSLDQPEEVEEERRLCYVGLTRARQRLYLTLARERALYGGAPRRTLPSRFLGEIGAERLQEVRR